MNRRLMVLTAAALSLTPAVAQTAPAPAPTSVTLPGQVPAKAREVWANFLAAGGSAALLNASGAAIGALNANGTVSLSAGQTLSDVKAVRLQPATGQATTVNVTRDLSRPGAVKIEWMGPGGKMQSLPLPAVVNRLNQTAPTTPGTGVETDQEDKREKDKVDKAKSGKPDTNPGKGKGKS